MMAVETGYEAIYMYKCREFYVNTQVLSHS